MYLTATHKTHTLRLRKKILIMKAQGMTLKAIGDKLDMGLTSINVVLWAWRKDAKCNDTTQLLAYALKEGIINLEEI